MVRNIARLRPCLERKSSYTRTVQRGPTCRNLDVWLRAVLAIRKTVGYLQTCKNFLLKVQKRLHLWRPVRKGWFDPFKWLFVQFNQQIWLIRRPWKSSSFCAETRNPSALNYPVSNATKVPQFLLLEIRVNFLWQQNCWEFVCSLDEHYSLRTQRDW